MDRRSALTLLVVFGIGVFLAGLELMITAVALPSMLVDLVEPTGGSAWIELRKASWIINGYLLVYVVTMPLAGRLADLWGARRMFMGALTVFVVFAAVFVTATVAVRAMIGRVTKAGGPHPAVAASLALGIVVALVVVAELGRLAAVAPFAALPVCAVALGLTVKPPSPRHLRAIGWTLVASTALTAVMLVVALG